MRDLLDAARQARERAYAPYSGFKVGCAVRTDDGRIFAGGNVENAAYPQGHCAERSAVGAMVAAGRYRITEVLVIGSGDTACTPCGGCRQQLSEFAAGDTPVHCCDAKGQPASTTIGELLPMRFGPADLGRTAATGATTPAQIVQQRSGAVRPRFGLVLGSGLGGLVERIAVDASIAYAELPGFPAPAVAGHAGRLVLGRLGTVPVACLAGRVHAYEGDSAPPLRLMIRTLKAIGCEALVLTNAAGSLDPSYGPGSLVLVDDHINLQGSNPLVGPNDDDWGPRFPDMSAAYDAGLRQVLLDRAAAAGIALARGVYAAWLGPTFETPAEIRALRTLGATLVGMSTVPEVIVARHCGLRCAAVSMVTNLAAGMAEHSLSHAHTLAQAEAAAPRLVALLEAAAPAIVEALDAVDQAR